jgi:hypothetical protein
MMMIIVMMMVKRRIDMSQFYIPVKAEHDAAIKANTPMKTWLGMKAFLVSTLNPGIKKVNKPRK